MKYNKLRIHFKQKYKTNKNKVNKDKIVIIK